MFRTAAVTVSSAIILAGCLSSGGSSGGDGTASDEIQVDDSPLITSITGEDDGNVILTVATDNLIDLRFSTASDCDWDNVSLCENGFTIADVGSEEVLPGRETILAPGTKWFVKAGAGTSRVQLASFEIAYREPVLFFGNSSSPSELIRTSLDTIDDEVILRVDRDNSDGPSGLAADSIRGWVYFSYVHENDGSVIDRVKEDGSDQERVAGLDRIPNYLAIDTDAQVLYASKFDGIMSVEVGDGAAFGEVSELHTSDAEYGGIAWNPVSERLLTISSQQMGGSGCRLSELTPQGQLTELDDGPGGMSPDRSSVALDTANQSVFTQLCEPGNLTQRDLKTATVTPLTLEKYSGRGMVVDTVNGDLIYRGRPNTVRRQSIEDPDDSEEILGEDEPSFSASAAILLLPSD